MNSTRRNFLAAAAAATSLGARALHRTEPIQTDTSMPKAKHIALIGDSIFDNGSYVPGKPSVIEQLQQRLGERGKASLFASDGDVTADVAGQLARLPTDVTHMVVSVGGNDALGHTDLLNMQIENSAELLTALARVHSQFQAAYANMLTAVKSRQLPIAVCTIYDSNFERPKKTLADVALSVFNDAILRCAQQAKIPVVDLRRIFTAPADYANPIEPSEIGGAKMVRAIINMIEKHDFATPYTTLYS